ncbi:ornithine carbamoyltransferase [Aerococcus sp. UMB7834]|uniref:ornithine carbamoyltransferase n=1 Tax=Aerococcus sp. UMB7834 TaxID=3046342 RepID=UPI00254EDF0E|nr:ornithine carbamoyltransferase [Aerococcus sp. UMB7834]MDK6804259.1 ornithine carbamoyltransferase [Aerococcus sp. UMB7834]
MLQGKDFLKIKDFTKEELTYLIDFAIHLKGLKQAGIPHKYMEGQNICLLFEKSSTRTRAAFTVAGADLGATVEFLGAKDIQLGKKESVADTGQVLGRIFDGIEYRGFSQEIVEALAEASPAPVWNGLSDVSHPTQMLADYMTIKEVFGTLQGIKLVYCGDGANNMANSLLMAGAILGVDVTVAAPEGYQPEPAILAEVQDRAKVSGAKIDVTADIKQAVQGAHVIYTDVWISMGDEAEADQRLADLQAYQVNQDLMDLTEPTCIFLHCLPAFHDDQTDFAKDKGVSELEVTDEVFKSPAAYQFQQAENRMHSIKSIMAATNGHLFVPNLEKGGGYHD